MIYRWKTSPGGNLPITNKDTARWNTGKRKREKVKSSVLSDSL